MPFTSNQQKALDLNRNIAVTASAGSGKTSVLVERYLAILDQRPKLGVENLLAITFTRKAAAEMRDRVREEVHRRIRARPQEEERWCAVRDGLPSAYISTIHSFCASVLRQHPVEAGVDPHFELLEDADALTLRRDAVDHAFLTLAARPNDDPLRADLRLLLGHYGRFRLHNTMAELLDKRDTVAHCFAPLRGKDDGQIYAWTEQTLDRLRRDAFNRLLADPHLHKMLEELAGLAPRGDAATDDLVKPNGERLRVLIAWAALQNETDLAKQASLLAEMAAVDLRGGSKKLWDEEVLRRCKDVLRDVRGQVGAVLEACPASTEVDRQAAPILRALVALFDVCLDAYHSAKGSGVQMDYADLEEAARRVFDSEAAGVGSRCREQFAFVLVDEFQDTNHLQWSIIRRLVQDAPGKLFVVGDPKQSIYAFRGAEVEVFEQVKQQAVRSENHEHGLHQRPFHGQESLPQERLGDVTMAENFRSRQAVVDFINVLFTQLMGAGGEDWEPAYDRLEAAREDTGDGRVELLLVPEPDEDEPARDPAREEARLLAARLSALVEHERFPVFDKALGTERPATFDDVLILLRTRRGHFMAHLEDALRDYRIPFEVVQGTGFFQRQEVWDVANVLRFLANPYDDIALVGALRSPLFGASDAALLLIALVPGGHLFAKLSELVAGSGPDAARLRAGLGDDAATLEFAHRTLTRWSRVAHRLPCSELIRRIFEDTAAWGVVASGARGDQDLANIEKLVLATQDFHRRGLASLADLAGRLDELLAADVRQGEAIVPHEGRGARIMTVHAAKGLEAPIVAVADLSSGFNYDTSGSIYLDRGLGVGILAPNPEDGYRPAAAALRTAIAKARRSKTIAEMKRLFYVACTRARDVLLLSGQESDRSRESWLQWLKEALGPEPGQQEVVIEDEGRRHGLPIHRSAEEFGSAEPAHVGEPLYVAAAEQLDRGPRGRANAAYVAARARLAPLPAPAKPRRFSPTELMLFGQCPLRHYFCYELGVPDEFAAAEDRDPDRSHPDPRLAAIARGNAAHRMFERLDPGSPDQDPLLVQMVLNELEGLSNRERETLAEDLLAMAGTFRTSPFGSEVLASPQQRNEADFLLTLPQGHVHGQIDKLYQRADRAWAVLDYKTNAITPADKAATAAKYELQVQVYALAARRLLHDPPAPIHARLYFSALNDTVDFRFAAEDLAGIEEKLGRLMAATAAFEPANHQERCPGCEGCGYREATLCRLP